MSDTVAGLPAGYRTTFAQIMRVLAMVTGTLAVIQFALAGYGAFSGLNHHRGYGPHEVLGTVISVAALLVLIAAVVARPGTRALVAAGVLFVVAGPIQPLLADLGKHHGSWWGAVHALGGVAVLAMCGLAARPIDAQPVDAR
jgi:Family of unknown function (DUF6220)